MVRQQNDTPVAVEIPVDKIPDGFRRLRRGGLGNRQRSQGGARVRDVAFVREDRRGRGRARPRLSAGNSKQGPDRDAPAELQVGQVRAEQRQGPVESRRHHRRRRQFRARSGHRQQRVSVAVELQRVQEVRLYVDKQRRVPRCARRPTAAQRRPHIRRRVRLSERFSRRLRRDLLCGRSGRLR